MTPLDHLNAAIANAGGIFAFARKLGITHQAVYHWKRRGWVPLERAVEIEQHFHVPAGSLIKPLLREALARTAEGVL